MQVTLTLLNPQVWLNKVAQAYGRFNETRQRWAAWQATLNGVAAVTVESLYVSVHLGKPAKVKASAKQITLWDRREALV